MAIWKTPANTNKQIKRISKNGTYSVEEGSGLYLRKKDNSLYFEGRIRFPFNKEGKKISVPIGIFEKEIFVEEAKNKWFEIKKWSKENQQHPQHFYKKDLIEPKLFVDVSNEYIDKVYRNKVKERTYEDRKNKLNQMLRYVGEEKLIADLEKEKGGRSFIKDMLQTIFKDADVQLTRCRQLLSWIFEYAEEEGYIREDQNPVFKKFQWETGSKRKISTKTFANTITKNSWGRLPEFIESINENSCNASKITDYATKAHLLMCIRSGVISSLEWNWYDSKEDMWIIPSQTSGLKRKKDDLENDHLIPSTPEINFLMSKVREISGWQKYCFYSLGGKNKEHLGEETINDHFKNLGWKNIQSAHQWRSVITTSAIEHSEFSYEIIDRQLGRMGHLNGTRGHYDRSNLLDKRRKFMEWWSKTLIEQGLII